MNKKQSKRKTLLSYKKKHTRRTQNGGVKPTKVNNTNLHNPQASLDLDKKFMKYDTLQGGSQKCGDNGVGTNNGKSDTFKQYLNNLDQNFNSVVGGNLNNEPSPNNHNEEQPNYNGQQEQLPSLNNNDEKQLSPPSEQQDSSFVKSTNSEQINTSSTEMHTENPGTPLSKGGGFTTDPSEFIAGQPVYKAYDDCCPPTLINGQLNFGSPDKPSCGLGAVKGGRRKLKTHSKKKNKKRTQRGGNWTSIKHSKPAMFNEAYNGKPSVFAYPEDLTKRTFDETQPNYTPNAI